MTQKFVTDIGDAQKMLDKAVSQLAGAGATRLFRSLARTLETETEHNFAAQGRPSWVPLAAATLAQRLKRNKGGSVLKILQDGGTLAGNIHSYHDHESAVVGAITKYAAIHQYGGTIERPAHSRKIRLRTDAKGRLERQGGGGRTVDARIAHGAIFANKGHKQYREQWATVDAYRIDIPARPYLPFSGPPGGETLQPEMQESLLQVLQRHMLGAFT